MCSMETWIESLKKVKISYEVGVVCGRLREFDMSIDTEDEEPLPYGLCYNDLVSYEVVGHTTPLRSWILSHGIKLVHYVFLPNTYHAFFGEGGKIFTDIVRCRLENAGTLDAEMVNRIVEHTVQDYVNILISTVKSIERCFHLEDSVTVGDIV